MSHTPPSPSADFSAIQETAPPKNADSKAKKEIDTLYGEQSRREQLKNVMNVVIIIFIIIVGVIATGIVSLRLVHLVLPPKQQWMSADQLQGIDKLFFSGAIGGILVGYIRKLND
jgi:hypothetical protein